MGIQGHKLSVYPGQSMTTRRAGGLDFAAIGGKRQGREVPQSLKTTRFEKPNQGVLRL